MESEIDKRCSDLSYRLLVAAEDFDSAGFSKALATISKEDDWQGATLQSRPGHSPGFHAHVFWRKGRTKTPTDLQLQVDFHRWKTERKALPGIYAEDFYGWAAKFLKPPKSVIHVHAEYELPLSRWRSKVMPLPLKVPFGSKSANVDGLSLAFPDEPEGVHGAWIQLTKKRLTVKLYAFRPIEFSAFKIENDLTAFSSVIRSIAEEKAP